MTTWTEDQKLAALLSAIDGEPNADARAMLAEHRAMLARRRELYEEAKNS